MESGRPRSGLQFILTLGLLPLATVILTLGFLEICLQLLRPDFNLQTVQRTWIPRQSEHGQALQGRTLTLSGEPGYIHNPEHPAYNAVSLAGADTPLTQSAGQLRILFLGDSVTEWQAGSAENWCQATVDRLNRPGAPPEFIALNAGHDGYGLVQEAAWLERFGDRFEFQALVLGFVNNDLSRAPERFETAEGIELVYRAAAPVPLLVDPGPWKELLFQRLLLPSGIFRGLNALRQPLEIPGNPEWYLPDQEQALRSLERIRWWCRTRGIPLAVVHFPVYWEPGQHYDELPESAIHRLLSARTRDLGIPYLDLLPAFQAENPATLFLAEEIHSPTRSYHPNARGHQLAADAAAGFLGPVLLPDHPRPPGPPGNPGGGTDGQNAWTVDPEADVIPPEELQIREILPGHRGKIRIHRYRDLYPDGTPHTAWLCDTVETSTGQRIPAGAIHFHPDGSLAMDPGAEPPLPSAEQPTSPGERSLPLDFYIPWPTRRKHTPGGEFFSRSASGYVRLNQHLYRYDADTWYPVNAPGRDLGFWQDTPEVFLPADDTLDIPGEPGGPDGTTRSVVIAGQTVTFIHLTAGTFRMGAPGNPETRPHPVTISRPFYLASHEVTRGIWREVMGEEAGETDSGRLPATDISWEDCQRFITRLNGSGEGKFRLPTEAEWEYAARAGTRTFYPWGDEMDPEACWFIENSRGTSHAVGSRQPNDWGFHDMIGNAWEWCADTYQADYYSRSPRLDPQGPAPGPFRVYRGGSWASGLRYCHVALRSYNTPDYRSSRVGFRLVLME